MTETTPGLSAEVIAELAAGSSRHRGDARRRPPGVPRVQVAIFVHHDDARLQMELNRFLADLEDVDVLGVTFAPDDGDYTATVTYRSWEGQP